MREHFRYVLRLLVIILLNICVLGIAGYSCRAVISPPAMQSVYRNGLRGELIVEMQDKLREAGFYFGESDGVFGRATSQAVRQFQLSCGLPTTGQATIETLEALRIDH